MLNGVHATGIGSLPNALAARERGVDPTVAARMTRELFPDLPYVVELPQRGAGADMLGRTAALLAQVSSDFAVSSVPTGWRRSSAPGADLERARSWWRQDLDAVAEVYADHDRSFKSQLCGPITFCRYVEDAAGEPSIRDRGFLRDVTSAFAQAAAAHVAHLRSLLPQTTALVLQIDEPALFDVIVGAVPTASGYSRVRSLPAGESALLLRAVVDDVRGAVDQVPAPSGPSAGHDPAQGSPAAHIEEGAPAPTSGSPDGGFGHMATASSRSGRLTAPALGRSPLELWLHDCGSHPDPALAVATGFDASSFDLARLNVDGLDACGAALDSGRRLVLGAIAPADWHLGDTALRDAALARLRRLRERLSISEEQWARSVTVTPSCGLAGAGGAQARAVMRAVSAAGRSVAGDTIPHDM